MYKTISSKSHLVFFLIASIIFGCLQGLELVQGLYQWELGFELGSGNTGLEEGKVCLCSHFGNGFAGSFYGVSQSLEKELEQ